MKRPRISLSVMMIVALLVAVDLAIMKMALDWPYPFEALGYSMFPTASLLLVCCFSVAWQLRRTGEANSFLVGFTIVGTAASMLVGFWAATCRDQLRAYNHWAIGPVNRMVEIEDMEGIHRLILPVSLVEFLYLFVCALDLTLPLVAFASLCGWFTSQHGITLVARGRSSSRPTEPSLPATSSVMVR
ncbi:MAG: hypothetical protein JWN86_1710 [Planctomycetota bacterium]|nr:hypothetical protein [Planctomycetota bacterium]